MTSYVILTILLPFMLVSSESIYGYDSPRNLIQNSGFEDDPDLGDHWSMTGGSYVIVTEGAHRGNQALRVNDRTSRYAGPVQDFEDVKNNTMYYGSMFIKLPNNSAVSQFYEVRMLVRQFRLDDMWEQEQIAQFPKIRGSDTYRQIGGDFVSLKTDLKSIRVIVDIDDLSVEYTVDSISMTEIPEDPDWSAKADAGIRQHRMENVTVSADIPARVPFCKVDFKVTQTEYDFPWGSAIQSERIVEEGTFGDNYRDFIFNNFNWIVFANTVKWKPMEHRRGKIQSERVLTALDLLDQQGIKARGHCIHWDDLNAQPLWSRNFTGDVLVQEAFRRVNYTLDIFNGRFGEWDVMNEWLRNKDPYFEAKTGDVLFHDAIFNLSREMDPSARYVINEYGGLKLATKTSAAVEMVHSMISRGVVVDGIGMQSHLQFTVRPEQLRSRLDILAGSGLPISITELTIHQEDEEARRDQLDIALRLYYANPAVRSITLWFWSNETLIINDDNNYFFTGEDFKPTLAGQHYLDLRQQWTTNVELSATDFSVSEDLQAFQGSYNVETLYDGEPVRSATFSLPPGASGETWQFPLEDADFPDTIPPEHYTECGLDIPSVGKQKKRKGKRKTTNQKRKAANKRRKAANKRRKAQRNKKTEMKMSLP